MKLDLKYDRAGRSEGIAFVTMSTREDAQEAIKEFDGANANGTQPGAFLRLSDADPLQANLSSCRSCLVGTAVVLLAIPSTLQSCRAALFPSASPHPEADRDRCRPVGNTTWTMLPARASTDTFPEPARAAPCRVDVAGVAEVADAGRVPAERASETRRAVVVEEVVVVVEVAEATGGLGRHRKSWTPRWRTTLAEETPARLRLRQTVAQMLPVLLLRLSPRTIST